jgi:hypothetical protein
MVLGGHFWRDDLSRLGEAFSPEFLDAASGDGLRQGVGWGAHDDEGISMMGFLASWCFA